MVGKLSVPFVALLLFLVVVIATKAAFAPYRYTIALPIAYMLLFYLLYRAESLRATLTIAFFFSAGYFAASNGYLFRIPESLAFVSFLFALALSVGILFFSTASMLYMLKRIDPAYFFIFAPALFFVADRIRYSPYGGVHMA